MNCFRKYSRFTVVAALLAAGLVFPGVSHALHATSSVPWSSAAAGPAFGIALDIGALGGEALERVWDGDTKVSELQWELDGTWMVGVKGTAAINNRFRVNAGFWTAINEAETTMVDLDWLYPPGSVDITDGNWTHRSEHPDTTVDGAFTFDINLDIRAFSTETFALNGIVGYMYEKLEWSARGGTFVYSQFALRDTVGSFTDGELVIEYEQVYSVPYFGVGADGMLGPVQIYSYLLYSPWVTAEDTDYHALRDTLFEGDYDGGDYLGFGVTGTYNVTQNVSLGLAFDWETIGENRGDVTITAPEGTFTDQDGGSAELESKWLFSFLLGYAF